jgi:hypothetical protein
MVLLNLNILVLKFCGTCFPSTRSKVCDIRGREILQYEDFDQDDAVD